MKQSTGKNGAIISRHWTPDGSRLSNGRPLFRLKLNPDPTVARTFHATVPQNRLIDHSKILLLMGVNSGGFKALVIIIGVTPSSDLP